MITRRTVNVLSRPVGTQCRLATTIASSSVVPSSPPKPPSSRGRSKPRTTSTSSSTKTRPDQSTISTSSSTSTSQHADSKRTQGRRRPYASLSKRFMNDNGDKNSISNKYPKSSEYGFEPVHLYPIPLNLHLSFTPPHQPIMANMGHRQYLDPPQNSKPHTLKPTSTTIQNLFLDKSSITKKPKFSKKGKSVMSDHLNVVKQLSHPSLVKNLVEPPISVMSLSRGSKGWEVVRSGEEMSGGWMDLNEDPENYLNRKMQEAIVKNDVSNEWEFENILKKLGDPSFKSPSSSTSSSFTSADDISRASETKTEGMDSAIKDLKGLMSKLKVRDEKEGLKERGRKKVVEASLIKIIPIEIEDVSSDTDLIGQTMKMLDPLERLGGGVEAREGETGLVEEVYMDSVKRKRRKKISKHKYKKRRKAERAQRKRLGK